MCCMILKWQMDLISPCGWMQGLELVVDLELDGDLEVWFSAGLRILGLDLDICAALDACTKLNSSSQFLGPLNAWGISLVTGESWRPLRATFSKSTNKVLLRTCPLVFSSFRCLHWCGGAWSRWVLSWRRRKIFCVLKWYQVFCHLLRHSKTLYTCIINESCQLVH